MPHFFFSYSYDTPTLLKTKIKINKTKNKVNYFLNKKEKTQIIKKVLLE